ncbi:nicotinate-nucleotide--dimethylbenzimidazole phosphoribosyltransferase [Halodesulfurarchaeum formicicum]|uniref:Nicotinate-nucleotide--dimethylbenzimidazole phosphoribosyltransferase n=1 Tax=Halodesulfurarchaeum formicicum TaxID=1873524 RepID=A0A1J1AAT9_9EURY|nr:nicotinate-nucleotide--dimethylbenzimidazole phosphoribosyltransferase [Halodesulfurarchaeum formicicum]APE94899.1 nicotinate-nucleotide--dimethylbenzimidazole phosphoribosyltransferase [Halodesulfurarchaeum formicicum]
MEIGIPPLSETAMDQARKRQQNLTKPPGSLGRLETFSVEIAGITDEPTPELEEAVIATVAGDHGVVAEGVSAFPQDVTAQMVANFAHGGAGVNALANTVDARNLIVDAGVAAAEYPGMDSVVVDKVGNGTDNIATGAAMSRADAEAAIEVGRSVVAEHAPEADIIGLGDMGIGNTTPSAAVTAAITGYPPEAVTDHGSGIDEETFERKVAVVERALENDAPDPEDGIDVLRSVGGFEIGALAGIALEGASRRTPIVVDGFITGAGALVAAQIEPAVTDYLLPSHSSVESGHSIQHEALRLDPLFDLDLRLGEGTGAALGIAVYKGACATLREMATFEEAGVSN